MTPPALGVIGASQSQQSWKSHQSITRPHKRQPWMNYCCHTFQRKIQLEMCHLFVSSDVLPPSGKVCTWQHQDWPRDTLTSNEKAVLGSTALVGAEGQRSLEEGAGIMGILSKFFLANAEAQTKQEKTWETLSSCVCVRVVCVCVWELISNTHCQAVTQVPPPPRWLRGRRLPARPNPERDTTSREEKRRRRWKAQILTGVSKHFTFILERREVARQGSKQKE